MKVDDAIKSIEKSTRAINRSLNKMSKAFQSINETNVLHARILDEHMNYIKENGQRMDETASILREMVAQNKTALKLYRWLMVATVTALIILAGVEKGVRLWGLL